MHHDDEDDDDDDDEDDDDDDDDDDGGGDAPAGITQWTVSPRPWVSYVGGFIRHSPTSSQEGVRPRRAGAVRGSLRQFGFVWYEETRGSQSGGGTTGGETVHRRCSPCKSTFLVRKLMLV